MRFGAGYEQAHANLANTLLRLGRPEEAAAEYRQVLQLNPASLDARCNGGSALVQQGRTQEAIVEFREALKIDPDCHQAHFNLGFALFQQGEAGEAVAQVQRALELEPSNPNFQSQLAWMLATAPQTALRNGARARQLATQANEINGGNNALVLRTLAAAQAETGEFSTAVQTGRKAQELAEDPIQYHPCRSIAPGNQTLRSRTPVRRC